MTITTEPKNSIESLIIAINTLSLADKHKLADILEQQIFEAEEESYEEDPETSAEIKVVKDAYEAGEYDTYDDYVASRDA